MKRQRESRRERPSQGSVDPARPRPRVQDANHPAEDVLPRQRAPLPAVIREVGVVPQDEVLVLAQHYRSGAVGALADGGEVPKCHELAIDEDPVTPNFHLLSGQTDHALQVIERNIGAGTELLDEVLDVSRIVGDTLVLDMRPLDLLPVVEAAVGAVRPSADAKGVALQSALGGGTLRVVADGARLHQVVTSLLANAVQFTPPGGQIIIRLERGDDRVRVIVSDTGAGMAPEILPDIFDRDRRRGRSSTRAHGGLGLGLTLVRRVVELHGGSIAAASAGAGRGATFTADLPLRRPERGGHPVEGAESAEDGHGRLDLLRVLVVDDHADTCELLSVILNERGATVVTARSVAEAQPLLTRFGPDVVLCDISMPGEDGFRLLDWVKTDARPQSRPIPVVALTAHARPEDRHRILSAGFTAYLPKPLAPSDVIGVVRSVTGVGPRGSTDRAR